MIQVAYYNVEKNIYIKNKRLKEKKKTMHVP